MSNSFKNKLLIFGSIAIGAAFIIAITYFHYSSKRDIQIVQSLQENVIPFIEENKVSIYFDSDWCKALQYDSRSVVELTDGSGDNLCLTNAGSFSESDWLIFDNMRLKLENISRTKFRQVGTEHPLTRPEHALFPEKSLGISFSIDCSFCRTRYVYWPNYTQLPPNIEAEITYTPINKDWYRIDQDWN